MELEMTITRDEESMASDDLWDLKRLGGIIAGARKGAGYTRMADLIIDMEKKTGVRPAENTMYDIENGLRQPKFNVLTAFQLTTGLRPDELISAMVEEHRDAYRRLFR